MVSYVILIVIVLSVSVGVYEWLIKWGQPPVDINCPEGTSLFIDEYSCFIPSNCAGGDKSCPGISLTLKNNGRFNINGVLVTVSDKTDRAPYILPFCHDAQGCIKDEPGYFILAGPFSSEPYLKSGDKKEVIFSNDKTDDSDENGISIIVEVDIIPFIIQKNKRIMCKNAFIRQKIENCDFNT